MYTHTMQSLSIYIHIPFCTHRCCYCDFNTYSGLEDLIPDYVQAVCTEAELVSTSISEHHTISTIYLGGGTPSLLDAADIDLIMTTLSRVFRIDGDVEVTMETNPGTVSPNSIKEFYRAGVNRLSIGMQSSHPFALRLLERHHDYYDVINVVNWARQADFNNINLDLMFGLPGQSLSDWQQTLDSAVAFQPEHFSLYALTIEDQTPMGNWFKRGLVEIPDPDIAADMYEWASKKLSDFGYVQYEISNWAKSGEQGNIFLSRHNLQYWRNLPYLGLGAGAHGFFNQKRLVNVFSPKSYIERINRTLIGDRDIDRTQNQRAFPNSPATIEVNNIEKEIEMSETMIMGLRLVQEGINKSNFFKRFGISLDHAYGRKINKLVKLGLLEWVDNYNTIRLTGKGRFLGNRVFLEFVN